MSLNQINNFDDLKKVVLAKNNNIEATPLSVSNNAATELDPATTVVYYEVPTNEGQLKFSIVYPFGCQNDIEQIIGINLFLEERKPEIVNGARNMNVLPFNYTSSLHLHFEKGAEHVSAWKVLKYLKCDDSIRDQADAKYEVQRNAAGTGSVSDATVYLDYSEVPTLLSKFPPVFTDMYTKLVGVPTAKYGFVPGNIPLNGPGYNNSGQTYSR